MKRSVRVCAVIPPVSPLDVRANLQSAKQELQRCAALGTADLMLLPPLFLTGGELGSFEGQSALLEHCEAALYALAKTLAKEKYAILAGLPGKCGYKLAVLSGGSVRFSKNGLLFFEVQDNLCAAAAGAEAGLGHCGEVAMRGADLFILSDYSPAKAGVDKIIEGNLAVIARTLGLSTAFIRGGRGDTTYPHVYRGAAGFCRSGDSVAFFKGEEASGASAALAGVMADRASAVLELPSTRGLCHPVELQKRPFLPVGMKEDSYCLDVFDLQCRSLAGRLSNLKMQNVVLALSGGLDSALALLVCAGAFDMLGLPRTGIHAVMMPGFGSSEGTLQNARELAKGVGATALELDIKATAGALLSAMDHSLEARDVVYENAQARVRTALALTYGNQVGGLMVGTGDLSEIALGFSTFGGDHLASYGVNACVPKTLLRQMLPVLGRTAPFAALADTLQKVLETPVSPELLPPQDGVITQRTEDILAPYELLDFFLYCFAAAKLGRQKTLEAAARYFGDAFAPDYLAKKLEMFYRRFAGGQFKRNSAPEAADITCVNLLHGMQVPADLAGDTLLQLMGEN